MESIIKEVTGKLAEEYDNFLMNCFAKYGYTKEWLRKNAEQVCVVYKKDDFNTAIYIVNGIELFKITKTISPLSTNDWGKITITYIYDDLTDRTEVI